MSLVFHREAKTPVCTCSENLVKPLKVAPSVYYKLV